MQILSYMIILSSTLLPTSKCQMVEPLIVVHGGGEKIPDSILTRKTDGVKKAAKIGYKVLKMGGSPLDAVEEAIKFMESIECFNAGFGSALNLDGEVEMDAAVMIGSDLNSGAVSAVKNIAHPVTLARLVMEKTPHHLLAAEGAVAFAKSIGMQTTKRGSLVSRYAKKDLEDYKRCKRRIIGGGGVGAIAIDAEGHLVAGASSGGAIGKMVGRSSDAATLGGGLYADDAVGAVVVTGHGCSIIRYCLAHTVIQEMRRGNCVEAALSRSLKGIGARFNNTAGGIVVSKYGEVIIDFTTDRLPWAYQVGNEVHYGIEPGEHHIVDIKGEPLPTDAECSQN